MLHVGPVAHTFAHLFPFALVFPYGFLALLNEGLDAVFLNLILAVQAQGLFHFQLHRQSVGVPSGLAGHLFALHGLEPGNQVLDGPGLDVPDVGLAVGRGRAVVEHEYVAAFPLIHGLLENIVLAPELFDFHFPGNKIQIR